MEGTDPSTERASSEHVGVAVPYPTPTLEQGSVTHSESNIPRRFASFSYPQREKVVSREDAPKDTEPEREPDVETGRFVKPSYTGIRSGISRLWRRAATPQPDKDNHIAETTPSSSFSSPEKIGKAGSENGQAAEINEKAAEPLSQEDGLGLSRFMSLTKQTTADAPLYKIRTAEKAPVQPGVYFRSRRVKAGEVDTSWLDHIKDPRQKWQSILPLLGLFLGLCISGVNIYMGYRSVPVHNYCLLYDDDFSEPKLNKDVWLQEVQVGGFGNGQFEETTGDEENVFIKDHMLHIMPTLQDERLITQNTTINLLERGTCTATGWFDCVATTNTTNGTIVNPVKSGRLNSRKGANIRFGRVEVVAKMPQGDWLWPAIWMFPTNSDYGTWPASGEIDIVETRGNNWTYPQSGNDIISSTLHWGPDTAHDGWWRTYHKEKALHSTFSDRFHTFGLEWTEKYIYTYLDSRLLQVLYHKFTSFWEIGGFTGLSLATVGNIWGNGTVAAPFDRDFSLILDVAVGGTNNWFQDGVAGKPWEDSSQIAKKQFWDARDQWYPTWENHNGHAMKIKSVKMWQLQGYNGCGDNARPIG
ncbi:hypothetical protein A1O1_09273 [Capronia coronata CBS 617.96]|uniref:GH16 domain-containing protein n=1 Tax=Capronia coronata CBS 617.96 TaxID=1182541 RepID=W9XPJ8_9EURO|nr:uncharacterized protein A1O1_09273 [Capronia coronata CBS 617.96]EXJ78871.1 hypothetical protein A1O1_09273 [Capronia coronata CBS 617.96]